MDLLRRLLIASVFACSLPVLAEEPPEDEAPSPDADVVIREEGDRTIQEYRINGVLYAIKVIPKYGKPYYLKRADGKPLWTPAARNEALVPSWQLFTW